MAATRKRRRPQYRVSYVMSIPVASSLWCGRASHAVAIFEKEDTKTMDKMIAACPGCSHAKHIKRHNTDLIGKPPVDVPDQHPWGYLTFGLVHKAGEVKQCIVSVVHHRADVSCMDALLREAETVPWRELKELNL